jgi:hypothetical protein
MAGSDRVPDPNDSERAQVGNAQTFYESEMALFYECMLQCARKVLDAADIVRDGDITSLTDVYELECVAPCGSQWETWMLVNWRAPVPDKVSDGCKCRTPISSY